MLYTSGLLRGFALLLCLTPAWSQVVALRLVSTASMPAKADSNSPVFWRDGRMSVLTSTGDQSISHGADQFSLGATEPVRIDSGNHLPIWFESTWLDEDGALYAWYHHEPRNLCVGSKLTAPKIGAAVSNDGGRTFRDLGIVLESGVPIDCSAKNGFFGGGHGDFSVIPDRSRTYFYFLFDNYGGEASSQGVAIARMAFDDRAAPVGAVWKYHSGGWTEPGLGGNVTPIFPVVVPWQDSNADAFWGPSIHWNTYLETYVVLMNHACCGPNWPQEGVYITTNPDLSDPAGWFSPVKILGKVSYDAGFYPQVIGTQPGETDSVSGQVARLWVHGKSMWEIVFWKWDDVPPAAPDPEPPGDRP